MPAYVQTIAEDRPLIESERALLRWLLDHGEPGSRDFLSQIDRARVTGRCGCGCASVDLAVDGFKESEKKEMSPVADFLYRTSTGNLCGVIAFVFEERLACLEVWSVDGQEIPSVLPTSDMLYPATEFKTEANQSPLRTPGSVTPAADAPVAPPPGAAGL